MKAHNEWLHETLSGEVAKKFELETANVTTIDEIILTISETAWRGALEEVLTQLNNIYDGDFENSDIVKWIKKELEE